MKIQIDGLSNRADFDGWAVFEKGSAEPIPDTFSTTRKEARDIRQSMHPDMFRATVVDKAILRVVRK